MEYKVEDTDLLNFCNEENYGKEMVISCFPQTPNHLSQEEVFIKLDTITANLLEFVQDDRGLFSVSENVSNSQIYQVLSQIDHLFDDFSNIITPDVLQSKNLFNLFYCFYNKATSDTDFDLTKQIITLFYKISQNKIPESMIEFVDTMIQYTLDSNDEDLAMFVKVINNIFVDSKLFRLHIHKRITDFFLEGFLLSPKPPCIKDLFDYFNHLLSYVYANTGEKDDIEEDDENKLVISEDVFVKLVNEASKIAFSYDSTLRLPAMMLLHFVVYDQDCIPYLIDNGLESKILKSLQEHNQPLSIVCYELSYSDIVWRYQNNSDSNLISDESFYKHIARDIQKSEEPDLISAICKVLELIIPHYPELVYIHIIPKIRERLEASTYNNIIPLTFTLLKFLEIAPFFILSEFMNSEIFNLLSRFYEDISTRKSANIVSRIVLSLLQNPEDGEQSILEMCLDSDFPFVFEDFINEQEEDEEIDQSEENYNQELMDFLLQFRSQEEN